MHLLSYVITHDAGFAPNPFGGFLILATCKPRIRKNARVGDYIIGTGSSTTVGNQKLVYGARIDGVISIADFGTLSEYEIKRPAVRGEWWQKHGDSIYFLLDGDWKQRRNIHHGLDAMDRDLSGNNVVICNRFWYFGKDAIDIPLPLREVVKKGPGHKKIRDELLVKSFVAWLTELPEGRHGNPQMEEIEKTKDHC